MKEKRRLIPDHTLKTLLVFIFSFFLMDCGKGLKSLKERKTGSMNEEAASKDDPTTPPTTSVGEKIISSLKNTCNSSENISAAWTEKTSEGISQKMIRGHLLYARVSRGPWHMQDLDRDPLWAAAENAPLTLDGGCFHAAWELNGILNIVMQSTLYQLNISKKTWDQPANMLNPESPWTNSENAPFAGLNNEQVELAYIDAAEMIDQNKLLVLRGSQAFLWDYSKKQWQSIRELEDYARWKSIPIAPFYFHGVPVNAIDAMWHDESKGLFFIRDNYLFTLRKDRFPEQHDDWQPAIDVSLWHTWTAEGSPFEYLKSNGPHAFLYVDTNTSTAINDQDGSLEHPWSTITQATHSEKLTPGSTVLIRGGNYHEQVDLQRSGEPGQPITFAAYPEEDVIIDGSNISLLAKNGKPFPESWGGLFNLSSNEEGKFSKYVNIRQISIINSSRSGFFCWHCKHISLENVATFGTESSGIGLWLYEDAKIQGAEIRDCNRSQAQECITLAKCDSNDLPECTQFADDGIDGEVIFSHIHHGARGQLGGEGIDLKNGVHYARVIGNWIHDLENRMGIYIDAASKPSSDIEVAWNLVEFTGGDPGIALRGEFGGVLSNVRVHHNVIKNLQKGRGIVVEAGGNNQGIINFTLENISIDSNIVLENSGNGVVVIATEATNHPVGSHPLSTVKNVTIVNNIIAKNNNVGINIWTSEKNGHIQGLQILNNTIFGNGVSWGGGIQILGNSEVLTRNNILSQNLSFQYVNESSLSQADHNLIDLFKNYKEEERGTDYIELSPKFIAPEAFNFHLSPESPAANSGSSEFAPTIDFEGKNRPHTSGHVSMGAYEP